MFVIYNILQLLALSILGPVLMLFGLASAKYRRRIPRRLGVGLAGMVSGLPPGPRVWIHALSVGEMASVRPLLELLRQEMPEAVIIVSATTGSGEDYARRLGRLVDCVIPFPFDGYWVVARFVKLVRPDLFVLVETDFWPNLLWCLNQQGVRCLLVNGRVTQRSMAWYRKFHFLFTPLFTSFWRISMQMADDATRLMQLGVEPGKIVVCGNLKYDMAGRRSVAAEPFDLGGFDSEQGLLLVAGSTHPGEEQMMLDVFASLLPKYRTLSLIIAPRDVRRASELAGRCARLGLSCSLRTMPCEASCQVLILDTLGELALVYGLADIAFVGGSLIDHGGHNPLEPAFYSVPVLFGPYMSDFAEISQALLDAGGAQMVTPDTLPAVVDELLARDSLRQQMGRFAGALVLKHRGAARCFLGLIRDALSNVR